MCGGQYRIPSPNLLLPQLFQLRDRMLFSGATPVGKNAYGCVVNGIDSMQA